MAMHDDADLWLSRATPHTLWRSMRHLSSRTWRHQNAESAQSVACSRGLARCTHMHRGLARASSQGLRTCMQRHRCTDAVCCALGLLSTAHVFAPDASILGRLPPTPLRVRRRRRPPRPAAARASAPRRRPPLRRRRLAAVALHSQVWHGARGFEAPPQSVSSRSRGLRFGVSRGLKR
jgi:hypothetical protein